MEQTRYQKGIINRFGRKLILSLSLKIRLFHPFFRQIHYAEELGSGFKKVAKYVKIYFGSESVIQEKGIFRFEAQFETGMQKILNGLSSISTPINKNLNEKLGENRKRILKMMKENKYITIPVLSKKIGLAKGGSWSIL